MPPTDNESTMTPGEIGRSLARIEKCQAEQTQAMHELYCRLVALETRWRFQAIVVGVICSSVVAPIAAAITLAFLRGR